MKLHDWVLYSVELDWKSGEVVLQVSGKIGRDDAIVCRSVSHLEVPRAFPWGPSESILDCLGPTLKDGTMELVVEMQSGDFILIRAGEIQLPDP